MVYLIPFLSYLADPESVPARPPVRPGYDEKYRYSTASSSGKNLTCASEASLAQFVDTLLSFPFRFCSHVAACPMSATVVDMSVCHLSTSDYNGTQADDFNRNTNANELNDIFE